MAAAINMAEKESERHHRYGVAKNGINNISLK